MVRGLRSPPTYRRIHSDATEHRSRETQHSHLIGANAPYRKEMLNYNVKKYYNHY